MVFGDDMSARKRVSECVELLSRSRMYGSRAFPPEGQREMNFGYLFDGVEVEEAETTCSALCVL